MTANHAESRPGMCRAALDALPWPVLLYDDTHVLYANDAARLFLGGEHPVELEGMGVENFILPDFAEVNNARRSFVINQGIELRDLAVKIRGLDGEPVALRIDVRPISFDGTTVAMATLSRP